MLIAQFASLTLSPSFSLYFAGLWGLFEWLILMKSNESFEYTSKLFMLLVYTEEIDGSLIIG